MNSNTARKLAQIPANHLIIGIDPHKKGHAVVVMTQEAVIRTKFKIGNARKDFQHLVVRTESEATKAGASGVIFAIEAGGHYWRNLAYYLKAEGLPFRMISPFTLKRRREGDDLTKRKNDYRDATMAAELLRTGSYTETKLPTGDYADLRAMYGAYRRLTKEQTRMINLLRGLLDGLFPEFCQVFKDPSRQTALAVLTTCPVPADIAALKVEEFIKVVRSAYNGQRLALDKLQAVHELASSSVGVEAGAQGVTEEVKLLVDRLRLLIAQIEQMQRRLREFIHCFDESKYLLSVRGLGELTVAGLVAEIGPLDNYDKGRALVKLAGVNPIQSESAGKGSRYTPMSKKGRSALRYCLWGAALSLLKYNDEFKAWAEKMQSRPASEHPLKRREVMGAVMNKLLRLYFALVKGRQMYRLSELERATAA